MTADDHDPPMKRIAYNAISFTATLIERRYNATD